jgi:hypothetical protein
MEKVYQVAEIHAMRKIIGENKKGQGDGPLTLHIDP